jgi:hypothetical protein
MPSVCLAKCDTLENQPLVTTAYRLVLSVRVSTTRGCMSVGVAHTVIMIGSFCCEPYDALLIVRQSSPSTECSVLQTMSVLRHPPIQNLSC